MTKRFLKCMYLILSGELSLITLYWGIKMWNFRLPIFIARRVHFRLGRKGKVIPKGGTLLLGCRWDISRFSESELKICNGGAIELVGDFRIFTGCSVDVCPGGVLSLGSGYINCGSRIAVFNRVTIGNDVAISENVTIRDSDNHRLTGGDRLVSAPITIGNHVWIGLNVTILKGVTIGDGAVIAANSLVNKSIPPRALAGGVPAKVIRENVEWLSE